jgi:pyruvate dehydrogenase E1 component alpha subunit
METYLLNDSIITEKQLQKMKESAQSEVDKAFDFAEKSPFPDPKEAIANLYAE